MEALTQQVLAELGERSQEFTSEHYQGVFIYKLILRHVFNHLKAQGDEARIIFLQKTLPINPSNYNGAIGD